MSTYNKRTIFPRTSGDHLAASQNKSWRVTQEDRHEIEDIFGKLPQDLSIDHIYSQQVTYGTINDALSERMANRFKTKVYGLLKYKFWSPWTSHLYPFHQVGPNESIDIEWDEIKMDQGIADLIAPLGVPRIFSSTRTKRGDRMERRGMAIFAESGFFMSPEGRAKWQLQIQQLATNTQLTCEYDVCMEMLDAWMNQPKRSFQIGFNNVTGNGTEGYMDYLKSEVEVFGLVNKTPDSRGLINLVDRFHTLMNLFNDGVEPDTLVFPPNMRKFYKLNNEDLNRFDIGGPIATENKKDVRFTPPERGVGLPNFLGFNVVDTQVYRSTTQSRMEAGDLLTTRRSIGEWYAMNILEFMSDPEDFKNYKTKLCNIQMHNEDQDRFAVVSFKEALASCQRWDDNDKLSLEHTNLATSGRTDIQDIFLYNDGNTYEVCQSFAEIEPQFMDEESLLRVANSILKISLYSEKLSSEPFIISSSENNQQSAAYYKSIINKNTGNIGDAIKLFLQLKICWQNIKLMCEHDIHIPFNIILPRPYMTYNVSTAIMCKAGAETGRMFIGQQNFQMSHNSMRKSVGGSWTFYSKAITLEARNIMAMEDIFIQKYICGRNTQFITSDQYNEIRVEGGLFNKRQSLLSYLVPENWDMSDKNVLDIRGYNSQLEKVDPNEERLFPTADYYGKLVDIDDGLVTHPNEQLKDYENNRYGSNTLLHRGCYEYGPDFDKIQIGMGHLGEYDYPGVGKTRNALNFAPLKAWYGSKFKNHQH